MQAICTVVSVYITNALLPNTENAITYNKFMTFWVIHF